jgi:hypothetical protein
MNNSVLLTNNTLIFVADHHFKPGNTGKPKGATNHITRTVKETVLAAFEELQSDPKANIVTWGRSNPGMFYQIAAKLIPAEVASTIVIKKVGKDLADETYE